MNSTTWAVAGPTPAKKPRPPSGSRCPPQFPVLPLQLGDPLRVRRRGARPLATVDLRLLDPVPQGLPVDAQLVRHPSDGSLLLPGLLPDLEHHPHRPLTDLIRILLRCWHDSYPR